ILSRLGVGEPPAVLRLSQHGTWRRDGERFTVRKNALWPRIEDTAAPIEIKETTVTDQPTTPPPAEPVQNPTPQAPTPGPQAEGAAVAPPAATSLWPLESRITIDDFMKIDLRVAKVLSAERVPSS